MPGAMPIIHYPWWSTVEDDSLCQGDLLQAMEIPVPLMLVSGDTTVIRSDARTLDLLILTQTCDILHGKVSSLLLCPWWELWHWVSTAEKQGANVGSKIRDALRCGNLPGYHLLNEASQDGLTMGLGVVDFHDVYTAAKNVVREFARTKGKRLRLNPPYREHLSQAFARFFMPVGLPVDIPKDKVVAKPTSAQP